MITLNNKTFLPVKADVGYSGYTHYYKLGSIPGIDYAGYEALLNARVPQFSGLIDISKLDPSLRTLSPTTGKWRWKAGYKTKLNLEAAKISFSEEDFKAALAEAFPSTPSEGCTEICPHDTGKIHRFTLCDVPATSKPSNAAQCNLFFHLFYFAHLSKFANEFHANKVEKKYINPRLETPEVSEEEALKLLKSCGSGSRSGWNYDFPTLLEFEDNREMLERVKEHLSPIAGLEITYLRKRWLGYFSDGNQNMTPDSINQPKSKKVVKYYQGDYKQPLRLEEGSETSSGVYTQPCIYLGEAWILHFTVDGKNVLGDGNLVAFATPEQFVKAYENTRPDLLKDFIPWSDFIFISSDWCERNGTTNYNKGIDLQTPHQRRMSLLQWVIGPCASRCLRHGMPFKGLQVLNGVEHAGRIDKLKNMVAKYATKVEV